MASSIPNKLFENQRGFPTPNAAPETTGCRVFSIPADEEWYALLMDAVSALANPFAWYRNGDLTQTEAANAFGDIIDATYAQAETGQCSTVVDTPFWDEDGDLDDESSIEDQIWYGEVEDPTVAPDETTFVENVAVWGFTGLLAVGVSPLVALAFNTIAPAFVVSIRTGDYARIIRLFVDNELMNTTSAQGDGSVIDIPVLADPELATHQIYLTSGEA